MRGAWGGGREGRGGARGGSAPGLAVELALLLPAPKRIGTDGPGDARKAGMGRRRKGGWRWKGGGSPVAAAEAEVLAAEATTPCLYCQPPSVSGLTSRATQEKRAGGGDGGGVYEGGWRGARGVATSAARPPAPFRPLAVFPLSLGAAPLGPAVWGLKSFRVYGLGFRV